MPREPQPGMSVCWHVCVLTCPHEARNFCIPYFEVIDPAPGLGFALRQRVLVLSLPRQHGRSNKLAVTWNAHLLNQPVPAVSAALQAGNEPPSISDISMAGPPCIGVRRPLTPPNGAKQAHFKCATQCTLHFPSCSRRPFKFAVRGPRDRARTPRKCTHPGSEARGPGVT
jgi:hypothetical protein